MAIISFPPVENATEDGLLAFGGDLELSSLLMAYKQGIFPWPISQEYPLAWFSPDPRGILRYKDLNVSSSLKKILKKNKFEVKFNHDFPSVIIGCKEAHQRNGHSTWITEEIILAYINLFFSNYAYSVETYLEGRLVGGIYGVQIGCLVTGESMFHLESNASKVALVHLMEHLNLFKIDWIDTQTVTPFIKTMGGSTILRKEYLTMLKEALRRKNPKGLFHR
jgi:leucyl/phenylalanyl-tRNA---protein transferase